MTWRHVKGHSGHKWNGYVDKQADLGRSGARGCGAPEWQDESVPTDADDGESSTVHWVVTPVEGGHHDRTDGRTEGYHVRGSMGHDHEVIRTLDTFAPM